MKLNEFRGLITTNKDEANILLLGVPFDNNASIGKGASLAPETLRKLSYEIPPLDMYGNILSKTKIFDLGDYDASNFEELSNKIYQDLESVSDKFHIVLGGDHSIAIASEKAFYKKAVEEGKEPVIIHIDAHPDICDEYHGSKYSHACPIKRALDLGFKDRNITLIGIRGFEEQEIETFKKHPMLDVYKAVDVNKLGVEPLLLLLTAKYSDSKYKVYISYDIDANDPSFAPGTGTPEAFGLKSIDVLNLIIGLISHLNVTTMDFVEIAPPLDANNITSWLALKTMYEIFHTLEEKMGSK